MVKKYFKRTDFNDQTLKNADDLENYIKYRATKSKADEKFEENRAYFHNNFYHYTKLKHIKEILENQSFLLSRCGCTNDPMENEIKDKDRCFALCFSSGTDENIPMWYLYSGVDGQGGCLTMTKSHIYDLVKKSKVSLSMKGRVSEGFIDCIELKNGYDFNIYLQDVLYVKVDSNSNSVNIEYDKYTLKSFSKTEFEKFRERNSAFLKSAIWHYEKETRLLIKLTGFGKDKLDKLQDEYENYEYGDFKIRLSFVGIDNFINRTTLVLAPEFSFDEMKKDDNLKKTKEKYDLLRIILLKNLNIEPSKYTGQIKMQLCKDCDLKNTNENNQQSTKEKSK